MPDAVNVCVGVFVTVNVFVGVNVCVNVFEAVNVCVGVFVTVKVFDGVKVGVNVFDAVNVRELATVRRVEGVKAVDAQEVVDLRAAVKAEPPPVDRRLAIQQQADLLNVLQAEARDAHVRQCRLEDEGAAGGV